MLRALSVMCVFFSNTPGRLAKKLTVLVRTVLLPLEKVLRASALRIGQALAARGHLAFSSQVGRPAATDESFLMLPYIIRGPKRVKLFVGESLAAKNQWSSLSSLGRQCSLLLEETNPAARKIVHTAHQLDPLAIRSTERWQRHLLHFLRPIPTGAKRTKR